MNHFWKIDLHAHSSWSRDCLVPLETIIQICSVRGINRIAITDHNTIEGAKLAKGLAPNLIIIGEEIMTSQGELLGYFLQETVPPGLSPQRTIELLRDQGAIISVAHPFDRLRRGSWSTSELLRIVDQIDAIEIFNAGCPFLASNHKAQIFAAQHHLLGTVGSDAHIPQAYGRAVLCGKPFSGPLEFLEFIRGASIVEGTFPPYFHLFSHYAKWLKKLRLKRRYWPGG